LTSSHGWLRHRYRRHLVCHVGQQKLGIERVSVVLVESSVWTDVTKGLLMCPTVIGAMFPSTRRCRRQRVPFDFQTSAGGIGRTVARRARGPRETRENPNLCLRDHVLRRQYTPAIPPTEVPEHIFQLLLSAHRLLLRQYRTRAKPHICV
jgi:hypothetical protein